MDIIIVGAGNDLVILVPGSGSSTVILGEGRNTIQISGVWEKADYTVLEGFSLSDSIDYEKSTGFVTITGADLADIDLSNTNLAVGSPDGENLEICLDPSDL